LRRSEQETRPVGDAPARQPDWALSFEASFPTVSATLERLSSELDARRSAQRFDHMWQLALAEACNNIVEHAYREKRAARIDLSLWLEGETLIARLTDTGHAMPGLRIPDGVARDLSGPVDLLPEGGFGWLLIRQVATAIGYRRTAAGNELSLTIPL
jgi:serine/threonine-protein kinase RsbW